MNFSLRIIEIVVQIVIAMGIIFAALEYIESKEIEKRKTSLDLISRFQDGHLASARYGVFKPWRKYNVNKLLSGKVSKRFFETLTLKIISADRETLNPQIEQNIYVIVDYFDLVSRCLSSNLCSKPIIHSHLAPYARDFYCTYKPYLVQVRRQQNSNKFGSGVEEISRLIGCKDVKNSKVGRATQ